MKSMSINSNNDNAISKTSTTITWLIYVLCKNKEEHQEDADLAQGCMSTLQLNISEAE